MRLKPNKWYNATVSWFNDGSGEGVVRTDCKRDYYIHWSAILCTDKWRTIMPGQRVKIQVLDDEFARHTTKCIDRVLYEGDK